MLVFLVIDKEGKLTEGRYIRGSNELILNENNNDVIRKTEAAAAKIG